MDRRQALEQPLHRRRERLVGRVHAGEQGVAADRRQLGACRGCCPSAARDRRTRRSASSRRRRAWTSRRHGSPGSRDAPPRRGAAGCMCSSPKRRPNALCWSCVSPWSRKKITWLSISASCTCLKLGSRAGRRDRRRDDGADVRRELLDGQAHGASVGPIPAAPVASSSAREASTTSRDRSRERPGRTRAWRDRSVRGARGHGWPDGAQPRQARLRPLLHDVDPAKVALWRGQG